MSFYVEQIDVVDSKHLVMYDMNDELSYSSAVMIDLSLMLSPR